jgi:hypothetical protein
MKGGIEEIHATSDREKEKEDVKANGKSAVAAKKQAVAG